MGSAQLQDFLQHEEFGKHVQVIVDEEEWLREGRKPGQGYPAAESTDSPAEGLCGFSQTSRNRHTTALTCEPPPPLKEAPHALKTARTAATAG